MKTIELQYKDKTMIVMVDDDLFTELFSYRWMLKYSKETGLYYPYRNIIDANGKKRSQGMNRYILGLEKGDGYIGRYISGNPSDNRRENLRVDLAQGYYFEPRNSRWRACIKKYNEKVVTLIGYYSEEYQAQLAYEEAVEKREAELNVDGINESEAEQLADAYAEANDNLEENRNVQI